MKTRTLQSTFAMLGEACLPTLPKEIRRIVRAACDAKGGPERMTLNDWREAEQEVNQRLNHESPNTHR